VCLIVVAWRAHPLYACLIAANRDEFHVRPSAPAQWWSDRPNIFAGRDLSAGGTWLGISRAGRFAALTNYRGAPPAPANPPSRGALVTSILESRDSVAQILHRMSETARHYNGFNVIFSDGQSLGIYESVRGVGRELAPGIYGLSNHLLDTPWPKVRNVKTGFKTALAEITELDPVLALLRDDRPARDEELPSTGVSLEWERLLSSAFVRASDYGTRCSTIIRVDVHGGVHFDEWTWSRAGEELGRVSQRFALE
jgi:uncharacterized protein with NRDE domain